MKKNWSRRHILKTIGLTAAGTSLPDISACASDKQRLPILTPFPVNGSKVITAITLGAGARGNIYGDYASAFPQDLDIIGVAEPIPVRNERYVRKHNIPNENRFKTWENVFERPRFADGVIISTPDQLHYGPCVYQMDNDQPDHYTSNILFEDYVIMGFMAEKSRKTQKVQRIKL